MSGSPRGWLRWVGLAAGAAAASGALPAPARPHILGVAHAAFYARDLARSRAFYEGFLGFAALPGAGAGAPLWIKINDRQAVELVPEPAGAARPERLHDLALEVDDAAAMRRYLEAEGVAVPKAVAAGPDGQQDFAVTDPNGNRLQLIQYGPDGWAPEVRGQLLPATRIAERMSHGGLMVGQYQAEMAFYRDLLGFQETWRGSAGGRILNWVNLRVPDGRDYVELMLYDRLPSVEGMHTMEHICLEVPDLGRAAARLAARTLPPECKPPTKMKIGVNGKRQLNYYDPDGTRVELMEAAPASGRPAPSSAAPPPP